MSFTSNALRLLNRLLRHDNKFNDGTILGSMCTRPHPVAVKAFHKYIEKNIGDPGIFPKMVSVEKRVLSKIGSFLSHPDASGVITTGGTEANILAMWTARNRRKTPVRNKILLSKAGHFSFRKAADLLSLETVFINTNKDGTVNTAALQAHIDETTLAIVGVAGTTGLGVCDDIPALSCLAAENDLYLHIDAAFGGFILPFLADAGYPQPAFDFSLPGVHSITVDPHKMGRACIPAGCVLYRSKDIFDTIRFNVTYLAGGITNQHTIVGTRSGASVASCYAVFEELGRNGYIKQTKGCMELTMHLFNKIDESPFLRTATRPVSNVVSIVPRGMTSLDFAGKLRQRGYSIAWFNDYLRVVVMPHLSKRQIDRFIATCNNILKDARV